MCIVCIVCRGMCVCLCVHVCVRSPSAHQHLHVVFRPSSAPGSCLCGGPHPQGCWVVLRDWRELSRFEGTGRFKMDQGSLQGVPEWGTGCHSPCPSGALGKREGFSFRNWSFSCGLAQPSCNACKCRHLVAWWGHCGDAQVGNVPWAFPRGLVAPSWEAEEPVYLHLWAFPVSEVSDKSREREQPCIHPLCGARLLSLCI